MDMLTLKKQVIEEIKSELDLNRCNNTTNNIN